MIYASNNSDKLNEIRGILNIYPIYSLRDKKIDIDIKENQDTFLGNAMKKAVIIHELTGEEVIADDSGLSITSLNIFKDTTYNMFLGRHATDNEKNIYLINRLNEFEDRSAKIITDIVYYNGVLFICGRGVLFGNIAESFRHNSGSGFDDIFELDNHKLLSELTFDERRKISTRTQAIGELQRKLVKYKNSSK